jgi:two-component system, chemotaxis family, response regulator Rcp1
MLRILLVEDNPADAQMLETALRRTGRPIEITVVDDGVKALEYLSAEPGAKAFRNCDVVLLDLNLPLLDGFEVLEHIRGSAKLKRLPVVVLSGSTNMDEIDRCYNAGANSYICKPIHLDEILATASRIVDYWANCVQLPSKRQVSAPGPSSGMATHSKSGASR